MAGRQYRGDGKQHADPVAGALNYAEPYVAPNRLRDAVNMALYLRRPLLVEGEPGTGKTRLAYSVAYELGLPLQEIYIRSTSRAQDLLWTYDAVRRLYDIQERSVLAQRLVSVETSSDSQISEKSLADEQYVKLGKLGEAIELSMEQDIPSVVLIDEIDKADVDFPNDLLLVLDRMWFDIDDVPGQRYDALKGDTREARRDHLPLVIITSNREKELPVPFLRRCLYYYIPFPQKEELAAILAVHGQQELTKLFTVALNHFWLLRDQAIFQWRKAPSTSELLDWVTMLERDESIGKISAEEFEALRPYDLPYLGSLLKNESDLAALESRRPVMMSTTGTNE